jgi:hypothetical protein
MDAAGLGQPLVGITCLVVALVRRERELVAVAQEPLRDRVPDPGVRAGDEGDWAQRSEDARRGRPLTRLRRPRGRSGVSSSRGAGCPFSIRSRSINSDASARVSGHSSPSRSQSAPASA